MADTPIDVIDLAHQAARRAKLERLRQDLILEDLDLHRRALHFILTHDHDDFEEMGWFKDGKRVAVPADIARLMHNIQVAVALEAEAAG